MATVKQDKNNPLTLEQMLRLFNRKLERDNVMDDLKEHTYAKSKSQKRKVKDKKAEALRKSK